MSEARKKLDIIYEDVLGDVQLILDRIDHISSRIEEAEQKFPELGEALQREGTRLDNSVNNFETNFRAYLSRLSKETDGRINKSLETAQVALTEYADKLAGDHVKDLGGVADEIAENAKQISEAVTALKTAAVAVINVSNEANPSWEEKRKDFLRIGAIAGLVGGIVAAVIASFVVMAVVKPTPPVNMSSNPVQYQR